MPATKTQLLGGAFQDTEGNVLANGYLKFFLNQDEVVAGLQICSGVEIRIQLDSAGNVASSTSTPPASNQFIWATDVLLPINAFYKVTGYTATGQIAWGPNNQQVTSGGVGGGTFNLGTWTPNSVFSWTPPVQPIVLQTNEVNNGSQTLLDLHAGNSITLVDNGAGRVTISSPRTSAFFYTIDGGGAVIATGAKGQLDIPVNCTITGWVMTGDVSGSSVVDVLRSTYSAFPSTSSISSTDKPTLVSAQKNENLSVSVWTTALNAGDQLQFNVNSASTVTRLNLTIIVTIP